MGILDYPRHFLLLGGGVVVLAVMTLLPSIFSGRLFVLFGVAAAAAASIVALLGAFALAGLVKLDAAAVVFLTLALTSALGAVLYWLLLRGWWAPLLSSRNLLVTVAACVAATLVAALTSSLLCPFHAICSCPCSGGWPSRGPSGSRTSSA